MSTAHPIIEAEKARKMQKAVKFAAELKAINTPKKTVIISIMGSYGYNTHDARAIYKSA